MKNLAIILFSLLSIFAIAQPSNNSCSGAITSPTNGSCLAGTSVGATDNWVGFVGCQSGNNPEVWYTFVAGGTQVSFSITSGTLPGNIELTLVSSSSPPCGGLSIAGSACGPSVLTTTISTTPGTTYYYTISSSTGGTGTFTTCLLSSTPPPVPGQDCPSPAILCSGASFSQGNFTGIGAAENISTNSCFGGQEKQSRWYRFSIGCSGTLEFNIAPTVSTNDIDFALYNTTNGICYSSGSTMTTAIACNWSGCRGTTGITSCANPCTSEGATDCANQPGCQAPQWGGAVAVTAGNVYTLLIDNFSNTSNGYSVVFGGGCGGMTAIIGPNAAFTGTITDTPSPCMNLAVTKTCPISPTTNSTYLWNFGDGFTATTMNASHTYSVAGNYNVSLTVTDLLGCSITTSQAFNIGCVPLPVELLYFTGTKKPNGVNLLEWSTATEKSNDYFIVERSVNAVDFTEIAKIKGAGNSNKTIKYSVNDYSAVNGTTYYRLKQSDFDKRYTYSNVISVSNISNVKMSVAPNPANDEIIISYNCDASSEEIVNIYDSKGNIVLTKKLLCTGGTNKVSLNISELNTGIYIVFVSLGDKLHKTKIIKN